MEILSEELIRDLKDRTRHHLLQTEKFGALSLDELNWRSEAGSWSVLECLEHLNYYGNFYLPEIEKRIGESTYDSEKVFKSGFLGNHFAKMMLPKKNFRKIKTFKSQDPLGRILDKGVIDHFIQQQNKLEDLLEQAKNVSLTRTKTTISISKWIRLRLGDTFRVVIYHNDRHVLQANNVIKAHNAGRE